LVAMKPTASSLQKSRKPTFSVLGPRDAPAPSNPSPMRHTAAAAVSKTTIGFPRARPAPSIIPPKPQQPRKDTKPTSKHPVNQRDIHPARFRELYGDPPEGSDMWVRLRQHERLTEEVGEFDFGGELFNTTSLPPEVDDEEVFQLPLPPWVRAVYGFLTASSYDVPVFNPCSTSRIGEHWQKPVHEGQDCGWVLANIA